MTVMQLNKLFYSPEIYIVQLINKITWQLWKQNSTKKRLIHKRYQYLTFNIIQNVRR